MADDVPTALSGTPQPDPPTRNENDIKKLLSQRTEILEVKLGVVGSQISERIRLRRANLDALLDEEIQVDTQLMWFQDNLYARVNSNLASAFEHRRFEIGREKRQQDVECWRDLVNVMREFLTIWEDLQQSKVRDQLLYGVPSMQYNEPDDEPQT